MFKIFWDKENNSILLHDKITNEEQIIPPRPVFFEELDVLGFDRLYNYPIVKEPLLWAIGRSYYFKGEKIAEAIGGGLNEAPEMDFIFTGDILPVSLEKTFITNQNQITILVNEAKKYINNVYKKHRKNNTFSVAFSGGKDSQVVLDLVSQVIPPEDYFAIFTDTEMELPETYETVNNTFNDYLKNYPSFNSIIAKQFKPTIQNWSNFGPPSRLQRWCCTVCKSLPHKLKLDEIGIDNVNYLTIEGVRKSESNRRSNYERDVIGVKHKTITNIRPIFHWNDTEVYLYLFYRDIVLNKAYRFGLTRVGCAVCPFSSPWSEFILSKLNNKMFERYIDLIKGSIEQIGIKDKVSQSEYLKQGKWKMRAGADALPSSDLYQSFTINDNMLRIDVTNPKSSINEWLKVLNPYEFDETPSIRKYQIKLNGEIKEFYISFSENGFSITYNIKNNVDKLIMYLKNISYKVAYCSNCGVCYAVCPSKAISMENELKIYRSKCSHCLLCLKVTDKGCYIAKSRTNQKGVKYMSNIKINLDKYSGFGLREEWLVNFFINPKFWNEGLGSKQIPAFRNWLIESNLLDTNKEQTKLYNMLSKENLNTKWQLIWINLCFNSNIVNWYSSIDFGFWDRTKLEAKLFSDYPDLAERTLRNALFALLNLFDKSYDLQESLRLSLLTKKGRSIQAIDKVGSNDINPFAIMYCLYKYAEKYGYYDTTLSELYRDDINLTPYRIFGIDKDHLKQILVSFQDNKYRIIKVEFAANLDNVFLNKDLSSIDVLEILLTGDLK